MLKFAAIMPAFCLLLLYSYYANNFAGKIDTSLLIVANLKDFLLGCIYKWQQNTLYRIWQNIQGCV